MTTFDPRPKRRPLSPIVLVDLDAISDMSPWQDLAEQRDWTEFFSHIPDAKPRDNAVLDLLELAKADHCWVSYTCRWDMAQRKPTWDWLQQHGFPQGALFMRPSHRPSPDWLQSVHARVAAGKTKYRRPVMVISSSARLAAEVRKHHVAAIGVEHLPETVSGFRKLLTHAAFIAQPTEKEGEVEG